MKTIVIVLVLAAGGYYGYKYFIAARTAGSGETPAQFLQRCRQASVDVAQPEEYCACLQRKGVKTMVSLAASPSSRTAVASCRAEAGQGASETGDPAADEGKPPSTGRGRMVDHMTNELQKAYKRRAP